VSDPLAALDQFGQRETRGLWTNRLIWFLRAMAAVSMIKGLYHWAVIIGIGDGPGTTFETSPIAWQAATMFFAVLDPVAGVGLWLAAAWGGVVWLTTTISMAAIELLFPQIFGGRVIMVLAELAAIFAYVWLTLMATRERPP
jgi:Family of unknown function (DUF6163)